MTSGRPKNKISRTGRRRTEVEPTFIAASPPFQRAHLPPDGPVLFKTSRTLGRVNRSRPPKSYAIRRKTKLKALTQPVYHAAPSAGRLFGDRSRDVTPLLAVASAASCELCPRTPTCCSETTRARTGFSGSGRGTSTLGRARAQDVSMLCREFARVSFTNFPEVGDCCRRFRNTEPTNSNLLMMPVRACCAISRVSGHAGPGQAAPEEPAN